MNKVMQEMIKQAATAGIDVYLKELGITKEMTLKEVMDIILNLTVAEVLEKYIDMVVKSLNDEE